ncbi:MAG: cadmium-translocating P-type ATPase [Chitinispirillales bacterium]|nr:cadmium-translocating P-type ATPase [Chitinispirillales bacterium]
MDSFQEINSRTLYHNKFQKSLTVDCASWINLCSVGYSRVTGSGESFYSVKADVEKNDSSVKKYECIFCLRRDKLWRQVMSEKESNLKNRRDLFIAALSLAAIVLHLLLRLIQLSSPYTNLPLIIILLLGGTPLVWDLAKKALHKEFGSDLLAGISIVSAFILREYLAGTIVVLMLSGGRTLEQYAVKSASSVLRALSERMPSIAHKIDKNDIVEIRLDQINIGDELFVYPHEYCPADGTVIDGHGVMNESYLTGEPYMIEKTPGSTVLSGSVNGDTLLKIRADKLTRDSRYASIMKVMEESQQSRPKIRRLGDELGAVYAPVALVFALAAWLLSGEVIRFLAVLVIATPCPLLIGIPVAIIGSVTLAAKRGIIIRDPAALEKADNCKILIFDKTGTLTYGVPRLVDQDVLNGYDTKYVLSLAASLERYSKHPLAKPILHAAHEADAPVYNAQKISEHPGEGLSGVVAGKNVTITGRKYLIKVNPQTALSLPPEKAGMECIVMIDGQIAARYSFRDTPRSEGATFIKHLDKKHKAKRMLLVSGDRQSEVKYLAEIIGIKEVFCETTPERKLEIVERITLSENTIFAGDGINDAPALMASTVGIAMGKNSDVTNQAAAVVIMDSSLKLVDEFIHISRRMRAIALQSAVGGMALSVIGMGFAAFGYLSPVTGALLQEFIDILAVLNALRAAFKPKLLSDY